MPPEGQCWVFHGRVQGVGFRATTSRLATGFAVSGHVRNLADGSVEVQAWGNPSVLEEFHAAILREHASRIQHHFRHPLSGVSSIPDRFIIQY